MVEGDRGDRASTPARSRWSRRSGRRGRPRPPRRRPARGGTARTRPRSSLRRTSAAPCSAPSRAQRVDRRRARRGRRRRSVGRVDRRAVDGEALLEAIEVRRGVAAGRDARRRAAPRSTIAVTEPLPLVPAMWIERRRARDGRAPRRMRADVVEPELDAELLEREQAFERGHDASRWPPARAPRSAAVGAVGRSRP